VLTFRTSPPLGEKPVGAVELRRVQQGLARELAALGLEPLPVLEGLAELAGDDSRVIVVPGGQERAVGRGGVRPLTRARGSRAAGVVALLGDLLEEPALGVPAGLQTPHLVGGGDEPGGEFFHLGVGPDRLPGDDSVVSGAPQGVPVHRPEEDGLVGLPRVVDGDVRTTLARGFPGRTPPWPGDGHSRATARTTGRSAQAPAPVWRGRPRRACASFARSPERGHDTEARPTAGPSPPRIKHGPHRRVQGRTARNRAVGTRRAMTVR